jgi:hypothetical protein
LSSLFREFWVIWGIVITLCPSWLSVGFYYCLWKHWANWNQTWRVLFKVYVFIRNQPQKQETPRCQNGYILFCMWTFNFSTNFNYCFFLLYFILNSLYVYTNIFLYGSYCIPHQKLRIFITIKILITGFSLHSLWNFLYDFSDRFDLALMVSEIKRVNGSQNGLKMNTFCICIIFFDGIS